MVGADSVLVGMADLYMQAGAGDLYVLAGSAGFLTGAAALK